MVLEIGDGRLERRHIVPTPDELVVHLREAGAAGVYLSRTDSFCDGSISIIATFPTTPNETAYGPEPTAVREMLQSVFEAIGDRVQFHGREWALEWSVEPAFTEPEPDLVPLYDRRIEQMYGDGFNLWNLCFVYEENSTVTSTRKQSG